MNCDTDDTCFSSCVANGSEGTEVTEFVLLPDRVQPAELMNRDTDAQEAREEIHPTADKMAKSKTNRVVRFFRSVWKRIKPFKKKMMKSFVPPPQTDAESPNPEMKADVSLADAKTETTKPDQAKLKTDHRISAVLLLRKLRLKAGGPSLLKPKNTDPADPMMRTKCEQKVNNHLVPVLNDYLYDTSKMLEPVSFARVYEGFQRSDGKKVAVKVMNRLLCDMFMIPELHNRPYPSEVALMLMLQRAPAHPNIIQMYDWCDNGRTVSLVLEFPHPCVTLSDFICSHGKLNESQAHHLWVQAVRAVHHCLKQGVYHTDIHLGNILVNTDTLELKLINFEVGKMIRDSRWPLTGNLGCEEYEATSTSVRLLGYLLHVMVNGFSYLCHDYLVITNTSISSETYDLIERCLSKEPSLRPTIEEIMEHPFFKKTFSSE